MNSNPYLDARKHWNNEVDRAFHGKHVWQLVGIASLLISVGSVGGLIYWGSQSRFVPYVIQVNGLGEAIGVGPASVAGPADVRVVRAQVAAFIACAREVTSDVEVQRKAIFTVYGMLKTRDPATQKMNQFLNGNPDESPFARSQRLSVVADISSVLPVSTESWQVDWQETVTDRDGALIGSPSHMRAVCELYIDPPGPQAKAETIMHNPIGVFVRDYNWQLVP